MATVFLRIESVCAQQQQHDHRAYCASQSGDLNDIMRSVRAVANEPDPMTAESLLEDLYVELVNGGAEGIKVRLVEAALSCAS